MPKETFFNLDDKKRASMYFEDLLKLAEGVASDRAELVEAREYLREIWSNNRIWDLTKDKNALKRILSRSLSISPLFPAVKI